MSLRSRGAPRLGLALGADGITATLAGSNIRMRVACTLATDDVTALPAALEELRLDVSAATGLNARNLDVVVALLPPLADARLIPLPPLREREAEQVIRRDAGRYFVGGTQARVMAVQQSPQDGAPVLAVAAPAALVEQIHGHLSTAGWRVRRIVPALSAWLAAAGPPADQAPRLIVTQVQDTLYVLRAEGAPLLMRRSPVDSFHELAELASAGPGRACVWVESGARPAIERTLAAAEWQIAPHAESGGDAATVAARYAARSALELMPQSVQLERLNRHRLLARQLVLAAAVLIVGGASVELWGARRELASLREQRAQIRQEVAPLLLRRDSIDALAQQRARIEQLRNGAPLWTTALFDLALLLPADAHLRALRATHDTVVIEATSARAGEAVQALRGAPTLRDVRLRGQIERDLEDGATARERFSLQARLVPHPATVRDSARNPTATASRSP